MRVDRNVCGCWGPHGYHALGEEIPSTRDSLLILVPWGRDVNRILVSLTVNWDEPRKRMRQLCSYCVMPLRCGGTNHSGAASGE